MNALSDIHSATRLSVRDLRSRFAGPFTFDLAAGECLAVRGPSGAGKSVLLRMLADLDPHEGQVMLDGAACSTMKGTAWRRRVVYQSAEPAWWERTAKEHFTPAQLSSVEAMLRELGMKNELLQTEISRLSTGERQRMALIRSIAAGPQVLLLDEPTAALDPSSVIAVESMLEKCLAKGMSLIIVTHSHEQAQRLAGRILHIENGAFASP
ncbi:MAG TPA: ATP-binding cassette domain-containing protein [Noviherbaspirillum sp.]